MPLQFLDQQHLMHVVARQAVWRGDHDAIQPAARGGIAQSVQAGTPEAGAAVAVVAKDVLLHQLPAASQSMGAQALKLLLNGLRLSLTPARNPGIGGYLHGGSPPRRPVERPGERMGWRAQLWPAEATDRPCPTAVALLDGRPAAGEPSTAAASWPTPRGRDPLGTTLPASSAVESAPDRPRRCGRRNSPRRVRQNLPFANRPS